MLKQTCKIQNPPGVIRREALSHLFRCGLGLWEIWEGSKGPRVVPTAAPLQLEECHSLQGLHKGYPHRPSQPLRRTGRRNITTPASRVRTPWSGEVRESHTAGECGPRTLPRLPAPFSHMDRLYAEKQSPPGTLRGHLAVTLGFHRRHGIGDGVRTASC